MKSTLPLFLAFLCLSTVASGHAQVRTITTCGTIISDPGAYELANDLLNCSGVGVDIRSNGNTVLNLNRHQITGASGASAGILARLTEGRGSPIVGIGGFGTISGFNVGVEIFSSGEFRLSNLTCTRNGTGFRIEDGAHGVVSRNTASNNGSYGIYCAGSQNEIVSNTARGNGLYDLFEANSNCVNRWLTNTFTSANLSCIH